MVIGTFAYCGSGQDTLADSLCKYKGFQKFSLGDVIRSIALERGLQPKREILQAIREEYDIKYGRNFVANAIAMKIENTRNNNIILTGIRTIQEYRLFKDKFNMFFIFVKADEKIRYQRMLCRADIKDECSLQELKKKMEKENLMFDYKQLEQYADLIFDFNMELSKYHVLEYHLVSQLINDIQV